MYLPPIMVWLNGLASLMGCDVAAITQVCVPLISHYDEDAATRYPQGGNFISSCLLPAKHENVTSNETKMEKTTRKICLQSQIEIKGTKRSHKRDKQQASNATAKLAQNKAQSEAQKNTILELAAGKCCAVST